MATSDYCFITHWRMAGSAELAYDILSDPLGYPDWWKGLDFSVRQLQEPDSWGINQVLEFELKGRLPYKLKWRLRGIEASRPNRFASEATGDLVGMGVWTFGQDGEFVNITFDWTVSARKPLLRYLSFLLKPLFKWNHDWVMKSWEKSLRAEMKRRMLSVD